MKEYAGIITGAAASMISFDAIWNLTAEPVENVLAWSFFIGLAVALAFSFAADKLPKARKPGKRSAFIEEDGLSVMIQRSSRSRRAA